MRLWTTPTREDLIVCNDEKLASGGTASYQYAAEELLKNIIFAEGAHWPDVILAPAFLPSNKLGSPILTVEVRYPSSSISRVQRS